MREKIESGMRIRHQWYHQLPEFKFTAYVLDVDEEKNELYVQIHSDRSGVWHETWNLAHTYAGFRQGEYVEYIEHEQ